MSEKSVSKHVQWMKTLTSIIYTFIHLMDSKKQKGRQREIQYVQYARLLLSWARWYCSSWKHQLQLDSRADCWQQYSLKPDNQRATFAVHNSQQVNWLLHFPQFKCEYPGRRSRSARGRVRRSLKPSDRTSPPSEGSGGRSPPDGA